MKCSAARRPLFYPGTTSSLGSWVGWTGDGESQLHCWAFHKELRRLLEISLPSCDAGLHTRPTGAADAGVTSLRRSLEPLKGGWAVLWTETVACCRHCAYFCKKRPKSRQSGEQKGWGRSSAQPGGSWHPGHEAKPSCPGRLQSSAWGPVSAWGSGTATPLQGKSCFSLGLFGSKEVLAVSYLGEMQVWGIRTEGLEKHFPFLGNSNIWLILSLQIQLKTWNCEFSWGIDSLSKMHVWKHGSVSALKG